MMNAVIIEDELNSREVLQQMLEEFCPTVKVVGTAANAQSGIQLIKKQSPDLIFLDIEMPGGDGFEVLKTFDLIPFKVIFVTGYDQYAIQAIRFSALDYLLKPVIITELQSAVEKAHQQNKLEAANIENLQWNLNKEDQAAKRLVLSNDRERVFVNLNEILFIQAEGSYVNFVLEGARRQLASYSLSHYEKILPTNQFFRTHKSYIVNCNKVISVKTGRSGIAYLNDGSTIPIAARRKSLFVSLMGLGN